MMLGCTRAQTAMRLKHHVVVPQLDRIEALVQV